jgi:P27 family predicted phage terminase small subunit
MNILGTCDRNALARYCQMFAQWRENTEFLTEHDETRMLRDKLGHFTKQEERPQVKRTERLAQQLLALERQFGLTPAARADLAMPTENPDENRGKNDEYFSGPRLKRSA